MKNLVTLGAAVVAIAGLALGPAHAQDQGADPMAGPSERPSFQSLDTDGDGSITMEELTAKTTARFAETDADGDGKLSADEMTAAMIARVSERAAAGSARMIERRDTDGDGLLSQAELGGDRGSRLFKRLDADADGVVTEKEFAVMEEMGKSRRQHRGAGNGANDDEG